MKFSERKGYKPINNTLQKDGMSKELRNSLWNVLSVFVWQEDDFMSITGYQGGVGEIVNFSTALWFDYFKEPVDSRPNNEYLILNTIRDYFFSCLWYEVYDFVEWTLRYLSDEEVKARINEVLKKELAAFRYIGGTFTDINDEEEVILLKESLEDNEFPGVRAHLEAALRLLSDREAPDYRNSIKESISAVESIAQTMSKKPKATLGDALTELEKKSKLHPALRDGFKKLYGYTSDEGGIRHAMLEEPDLDAADAKFFLLSCTSFVNYLKSKI